MEILIADDEAMAIEILRNALEKMGHDVLTAENGRQAMEILRNNNCRFVISDWDMPEMSGVELCQKLRQGWTAEYIYFILLTSYNNPEEIVEGLSAGADDFISKPFKHAELAMRIRAGERIMSLATREVAIFAMAQLAESRDPETGGHLERLRSYSEVLAKHLSGQREFRDVLNVGYIKMLYLTSSLHDIGKVGIPDSVLLKPGRLNDREFNIMKAHTIIGSETLEAALKQFPSAEYLKMAHDIAKSHHERFDGTGYPERLDGEHIPLCARIVALADVYDALVSKRLYKKAFVHDVARSIIVEESGSHFDPDIVRAFVATEESFVRIAQRFSEDTVGFNVTALQGRA